jgi:hypothetical protein
LGAADGRAVLPIARVLVRVAAPERIDGLIGENVVLIVGLRPTHAFQGAL